MNGKAIIDGKEERVVSPRQIAVAQAYVAGLENDRTKLNDAREALNQQTWEIVKLGSYNRALHRALTKVMTDLDTGKFDPEHWDRALALLTDAKAVSDEVFPCPCGHSKWDHDEHGCLYLGCKVICG